MVFSPFRSAISHAPRVKPKADEPFVITHRPPGSRRPHPDAKVTQVRRLIETTTMTYREISKRTGVPYTNISRWANEGNWTRPLFAPRAPDTVPRWRARRNLRRRTLAARIDTLAERRVRALEAAPGIDLPACARRSSCSSWARSPTARTPARIGRPRLRPSWTCPRPVRA